MNRPLWASVSYVGADSGATSRGLPPANSTLARNSDQSNTSGGGTVNMSRGQGDLKDTACSEKSNSQSEGNSESPKSVTQVDGSMQLPTVPSGNTASGPHNDQVTGQGHGFGFFMVGAWKWGCPLWWSSFFCYSHRRNDKAVKKVSAFLDG